MRIGEQSTDLQGRRAAPDSSDRGWLARAPINPVAVRMNETEQLSRSLAVLEPRESEHARLDAPPIRYVVNGREYIALCADVFSGGVERNVVMSFALPAR